MAYSDNKSSIHLMAKIQLPYPSTTIKGWEEKKRKEKTRKELCGFTQC
jgi:hypothetical protein